MKETSLTGAVTVVKVGGSLFDLPDLARRLTTWLHEVAGPEVLLVPGGGVTAHAVRSLDAWQQLGEDKAHWLALRSLSLNAHFLAALLPRAKVIGALEECEPAWRDGTVPVVDAYRFAEADEGQPGCLPHHWTVTSDSVAARVAIVAAATRLILLKSVTIPTGLDWAEAARRGFVDSYFATVLEGAALDVAAVNFKEWTP